MSARGIRIQTVEEVPVLAWQLQGTIYDSVLQAKFAAAKLWASASNIGVRVIKVKSGWTVLFWRRGVIKQG